MWYIVTKSNSEIFSPDVGNRQKRPNFDREKSSATKKTLKSPGTLYHITNRFQKQREEECGRWIKTPE